MYANGKYLAMHKDHEKCDVHYDVHSPTYILILHHINQRGCTHILALIFVSQYLFFHYVLNKKLYDFITLKHMKLRTLPW